MASSDGLNEERKLEIHLKQLWLRKFEKKEKKKILWFPIEEVTSNTATVANPVIDIRFALFSLVL